MNTQIIHLQSQNYHVEVNFCSIYEASCPLAFKVGHRGVLLYGAIAHRTAVVDHMDLLGPKLAAHQRDVLSRVVGSDEEDTFILDIAISIMSRRETQRQPKTKLHVCYHSHSAGFSSVSVL